MIERDNFFKNFFINSNEYNRNLIKTKKLFKSLLSDLEKNQIPLLETYTKDYDYDFSKKIVNKFSKYKNIIIIGMGGSILGIKSIYSFLKKNTNKKIFFFDNLDLNLNLKYNKIKNLNNSCYIIISKSGETLETLANLGVLFSKKIKNKLVIITEVRNNSLMEVANKYDAEVIEHKWFVGGRYSVLSEPGMFPAALIGLKPIKFKNLKKLVKNKNFVSSLTSNVASIYTLNLKGIRNSIILNYDSNLNDFGYWYQQLVAESLGKKKKGINPFLSFCPKDHHSLLQLYLDGPKDKFFTFLSTSGIKTKFKVSKNIIANKIRFLKNRKIEFIIKSQSKALKKIFKVKKIPFREIVFKKRNEESLGEIFTFLVLETILLSRLMKINPFDQPAVEQVKIETKKLLT